MEYKIIGDNLQVVELHLRPDETIYSESGTMKYMSNNIRMETNTKGGVFKGLKRALSGENLFMTNFTAEGAEGMVAFGGTFPGKILPLDIGASSYICQGSSFLCAEDNVEVDISVQKKISAGLFGGEGFLLQRVSGNGKAFIAACGDISEFTLGPDEILKVSTGNAVLWEEGVDYEIKMMKGVKNILFGGEGIFVTTLRGPGKVVVQSMTPKDLAMALSPLMPPNND